MFIKYTKASDKEYVQIVKSFRKAKKVKHKVILNLGRRDEIDNKDVESLISALQKYLKEAQQNNE